MPQRSADSFLLRRAGEVKQFLNLGEELGPFVTTRLGVQDALRMHLETPLFDHLEIETYTWDVLPAHLGTGDIVDYVTRVLEFVRSKLVG